MKKESQIPNSLLKFEHRKQPLLARNLYLQRLFNTSSVAFAALTAWVLLGMLGYHYLGKLHWVDSFLNASMIVGGMGEIDPLTASSAKIFAGFYAIFSGVIILTLFAVMAAPVYHRFIHKFHLGIEEIEGIDRKGGEKSDPKSGS